MFSTSTGQDSTVHVEIWGHRLRWMLLSGPRLVVAAKSMTW
ncbi:TPA: hypothetical protein ACIBXF_003046 [Salmonella enterica subsp. enterica serovar Mississippi]|nr:hypothetical protein [Salmonella enterica]